METGPDNFSIFLDKTLVLQHSRRRPLFRVGLGQRSPEKCDTSATISSFGSRAVRQWEVIRASPDLIELRFPGLFSLSLARKENATMVMSFSSLGLNIQYFRIRLPVLRKTHFEFCGPDRMIRLKKNQSYAWQTLLRPAHPVSASLLSNGALSASSKYRLAEAVYGMKALITSSNRYIYLSADSAACRHQRRFLFLDTAGLPAELRMGSTATRSETLRRLSIQANPPACKAPDWIHDGLCVELSGGIETATRRLHTLLDNDIHINAILLKDWAGLSGSGRLRRPRWDLQLDNSRYANLQEDAARFRQAEIRTLAYLTPYLDVQSAGYQQAATAKLLVQNDSGEVHVVRTAFGSFAFWDLWKPATQDYLRTHILENMISLGFAGWFADYGSFLPPKNTLLHGLSPAQARLQYPQLWAELTQALTTEGRHGLVGILRAGGAMVNQASLLFCAPPTSSGWQTEGGLADLPRQALSAARSGAGLWFSGIGGSFSKGRKLRTPELLMRWYEMAAFTLFLYNEEAAQPERQLQLWQDKNLMRHCARFTKVFRMLKPYRQELLATWNLGGTTPIQDCASLYPGLRTSVTPRQFMLGPDLLVAPTLQAESSSTTLTLPEDAWVHVWSSREFGGGNISIESPPGYPAVFYRRDSNWAGLLDTIRVQLSEF